MDILETRVLRGPNLYADFPCYLAVVALSTLASQRPADVPGFVARLSTALPELPGLADASMALVIAKVIVALQRRVGAAVTFAEARPVARHPDRFEIVAAYVSERVAEAAFKQALALVSAWSRGEAPSLDAPLGELNELAEATAIGPSTQAILDAAQRRGIPVFRTTEQASLFQLGWGQHAKRVRATITSHTSDIAVDLAQDKDLTKALLAEAGLPVPKGAIARDAEQAVAIAARLRAPVAIKPLDGNQGKGVSLGLTTPEQVRAAYALAATYRRSVLVEQFIEGEDYRVLVVGDQVIAAARRRPAQVLGDGTHTVAELVAEENKNPDRGNGHLKPMTRITLDEGARQVLERQRLTFDSVPTKDQLVVLKENANLSTGGTAEDVTDLIHPANALACVRAARKIGLDVAGIDLVCRDIAVPLGEQRGALIEVNAAPGIRMHQHPAMGQPHDVGAAIVDALFPPGAPVRVPVIAVTGTNGKTTTTLLLSHVLERAGVVTGTTTTEAIYVGGRVIASGDCTGYWSARTVLTDPAVEAAVLEVARGGIFKRGLAFDQSDVGVVLNIHDDHLGQHGAETLEDLARVKGLIVRTARRGVVLNADDPQVIAMAGWRPAGAELVYFSLDPEQATMQAHLEAGGRAVYLRRHMIMLAQGDHRIPLLEIERVPFTLQGRARFNVANALAAVAALWVLGRPLPQIVAGLSSFTSGVEQNPGRMNFFRIRDFQVIADYAHNPDSYRALIETARALPHRRLVGVIAAPGDRYDEKLKEIGAICGRGFDRLIIREMAGNLRGRAPGETPRLIAEGARAAGMAPDRLSVVLDEPAAIEEALAEGREGDLIVVGCADTPRLLSQLARHAEGDPAGRARLSPQPR